MSLSFMGQCITDLVKGGGESKIHLHSAGAFSTKQNETGSRSPCMRPRSNPPNFGPIERGEKQTNNID